MISKMTLLKSRRTIVRPRLCLSSWKIRRCSPRCWTLREPITHRVHNKRTTICQEILKMALDLLMQVFLRLWLWLKSSSLGFKLSLSMKIHSRILFSWDLIIVKWMINWMKVTSALKPNFRSIPDKSSKRSKEWTTWDQKTSWTPLTSALTCKTFSNQAKVLAKVVRSSFSRLITNSSSRRWEEMKKTIC